MQIKLISVVLVSINDVLLFHLCKCHRETSLDVFFEGIFVDSPKKLAIVGCGCSTATEPVAEISHQWNISLVSIEQMHTPINVHFH